MNRTFLQALSGVVFLGALIGASTVPVSLFRDLETTSAQAQTSSNSLQVMTIERLETILQDETSDLQGENGQWQLTMEEQSLVVLADATNNRMRIVTPIAPANALSAQQVEAMLVANFHSALDARYAVTNGTVVSIFVHPLASLQEADLRSGLRQVTSLAITFGTRYSSGELGFGPNGESQERGPSSRDQELEI